MNKSTWETTSRMMAVPPTPPPGPPEAVAALVLRVTGVDLTRCAVCGVGRLRVVASFGPGYFPAPPLDTS